MDIGRGDCSKYHQTYFNPFTGEIQYVNLPLLVNWKDEIVPTINQSSITDEFNGTSSTVIGPIGRMRGDTMNIYVRYNHKITKWTDGSSSYTSKKKRYYGLCKNEKFIKS